MSSTTSSDCDSCDCSQCTYSFENNHNDYGKLLLNSRHIPMYATMAHPLVYYAEIQPLNKRQPCEQPKKDNPFKKAFKWYTQERTLCNKTDVAPERSGFANWLDNKYAEYLRECGQQPKAPMSYEPRAPKTSTAESCAPCPGTTKKCGRFKSPWRKRRRSGNDSGDVPKKCPEGSCEFLLKPKELTRAASEPSYHTPTSGAKSNSTVASSNMPCNPKCSGRSHSLSDVAREKSELKHGDTVPPTVQECHCLEQAPKLTTRSCVCPQGHGPSKEQDATNQAGPCFKCLQEKVPEIEQVPTIQQNPTNQPKPLQEEVLKIVEVLSKEQDPTYQPKPLQEEVPNVVKVLSKEQDPTNQPKLLQKAVRKVPSTAQCPRKQQGECCKCNLKKVPKVVQVPSQSRAVQVSCQCPEEKVVPVNEETQYAPGPARSTLDLGPCCCNICNKSIPPLPPQMLCIPVKVQSNKIANPEMCLTIVPAQNDATKKQKAKQLSVSCQSGESNKSKVDSQSQHQPEPSAYSKATAASPKNCHEVNQVFGPIPIRRQSYSTVAITEETGEYNIVKDVTVVNKFTRSSNDAAQTSDHSIRLEKEPCSCQYPLFFKIICADNIKE